ncbi:MAG: ABC transporter ATP-binding protein, partial [Acidithiobacillus sp.]
GIRIQTEPGPGLPARLRHQAFERGHYRSYWEVPGLADPVVAFSPAPTPTQAVLLPAEDQIFFYTNSPKE